MSEATRAPGLFSLAGQVALVTGATGGLGQAIALAYAQHGASLVLSDRDDAALRDIAARCASLGGAVRTVVADLSVPAQVQALAEQARTAFGRIDLLVCNAGMQGPAGPLLEVPTEDWHACSRSTWPAPMRCAPRCCRPWASAATAAWS